MLDRLAELSKATQKARAEGTAFEEADRLERGAKEAQAQPQQSFEDEALQMQDFYAKAKEINDNTHKIESLADEMEKFHKQALAAADTNESVEASQKVDLITAKINQYANRSRASLKEIEVTNQQLKEIAPPGSGHMRMREAKHRQLATSFLKVTKRLQKMQQIYRDKYHQQLERQYKIVNPKATPEEIACITSDEAGAQQQIFAAAVKEDAKKTLSQMKDRLQDVKLIEKSILELHQLFLDLQTLVVEQGDIINRVGFNVDTTVSYTESAAEDLKQAVVYQKSIWKKKWIMIVLCIVGCLLLLMLLLYILRPVFQLAFFAKMVTSKN